MYTVAGAFRKFIDKVIGHVPARVTHRLVKYRLVQAVLFRIVDKQQAELLFQRVWARRFRRNPEVLEQYWREYRELDRIRTLVTERSRVLDVGCGISTVLHLLPGERIGVDALAEAYKKLYEYPAQIRIEEASAESLPFEEGFFDLVFCSNALDHMTSPKRALDEMRRVLRPDGRLILTVEVFEGDTHRDPAHPHALDVSAVKSLLGAAEFDIEHSALAPWIGIARYLEGVRSSDEQELFVIASPSNAVS
jgi:SAM-dependent methyltransferase